MGLSIYYSDRFNPASSLANMIETVEDIAKIYNWKYNVYETTFPEKILKVKYTDKIYGISFTPPHCETITLEFLSNMRMNNSALLKYFGFSDNPEYKIYLYQVFAKTQFA